MTSAIATIAYRDLLKFLRDRPRIFTSLLFPIVFVVFFGISMQSSLENEVDFNYLAFTFTGMLALTLFQSSALGIISLIDDRASDFSQEIFVAPISRYAIVLGKITGESLVAIVQGILIIVFSRLIGVQITLGQIVPLLLVSILVCLAGGSFGLVVMVNIKSRRAAEQVFPMILLPQYFLAGVFAPITNLPPLFSFVSKLAPLRYAVDLVRGVFYATSPVYASDGSVVVLASPAFNTVVLSGLIAVCLVIGTRMFVGSETNR